jgi:hypothetical protein
MLIGLSIVYVIIPAADAIGHFCNVARAFTVALERLRLPQSNSSGDKPTSYLGPVRNPVYSADFALARVTF